MSVGVESCTELCSYFLSPIHTGVEVEVDKKSLATKVADDESPRRQIVDFDFDFDASVNWTSR